MRGEHRMKEKVMRGEYKVGGKRDVWDTQEKGISDDENEGECDKMETEEERVGNRH